MTHFHRRFFMKNYRVKKTKSWISDTHLLTVFHIFICIYIYIKKPLIIMDGFPSPPLRCWPSLHKVCSVLCNIVWVESPPPPLSLKLSCRCSAGFRTTHSLCRFGDSIVSLFPPLWPLLSMYQLTCYFFRNIFSSTQILYFSINPQLINIVEFTKTNWYHVRDHQMYFLWVPRLWVGRR